MQWGWGKMRIMLPSMTSWVQNPSLIDIFGLKEETNTIISVVGAGGKTSTIEYLANEYNSSRKKVVVTTTTHMFEPEKWAWCKEESLEMVDTYLERENVLWLGLPCNNGKMKSPEISFLEQLKHKNIPMLIEADGAKRLPFKVPGEKEPVILEGSNLVIGVLGMDAIGKAMNEVCFRYEIASKCLNKLEDEPITREDYVKVISNDFGLKKGIKKDMKYIVFLNKVDDEEKEKEALLIRDMLKECGINNVYLSSYRV